MRGKCDNKEGDVNLARPFPRVLGYKRGSDITEVRVYLQSPGVPDGQIAKDTLGLG